MDKQMKNRAMLIEWRYTDEEEPTYNSYVVVSYTGTELGDVILDHLDKADYNKLNEVLMEKFNLRDDDVVFYISDPTVDTLEGIKSELRHGDIELLKVEETIEEN